jgi:hypothetical protein
MPRCKLIDGKGRTCNRPFSCPRCHAVLYHSNRRWPDPRCIDVSRWPVGSAEPGGYRSKEEEPDDMVDEAGA